MTGAVPLAPIGRLNIHARSSRGRKQRSAIYSYKALAALSLVMDGNVSLRFVKWTGKCIHCDKGRFTHWSWDDGYTVRCRDCGGTGQRALRFVETALPDGQVWHHPWSGSTQPGWDIARAARGVTLRDGGEYHAADGSMVIWEEPGEWRPMLPAEPLPLEKLVADLNQVEDWVEEVPNRARGQEFWWYSESAKRHLRQQKSARIFGSPDHGYSLDLGRAPGGCLICGTERDLDTICFGRITPLFHWSLPVCRTHRSSPHPKDPPPEVMITPAIRRWLDRHECVEVRP